MVQAISVSADAAASSLGDPLGPLGPVHRRGQINETQREPRDLIHQDPPKAPQCGADEPFFVTIHGLLRAAGNEPQRDVTLRGRAGHPRHQGDQLRGVRNRRVNIPGRLDDDQRRFAVILRPGLGVGLGGLAPRRLRELGGIDDAYPVARPRQSLAQSRVAAAAGLDQVDRI